MSFYFADEVKNFLFKGWTTFTTAGFVGTCLAVVAAVCILEGIKLLRLYLRREATRDPLKPPENSEEAGSRSLLVRDLLIPPSVQHIHRRRVCLHVYQTCLKLLEVVLGYLLMLAVMTYNSWFIISVAIASGLAYYFMGLYRCELDVSHAPRRTTNNINSAEASDRLVSATGTADSEELTSSEHTPSVQSEVNMVNVTADMHI